MHAQSIFLVNEGIQVFIEIVSFMMYKMQLTRHRTPCSAWYLLPTKNQNGSITLNACVVFNIVTCDYICTKKVWQTDARQSDPYVPCRATQKWKWMCTKPHHCMNGRRVTEKRFFVPRGFEGNLNTAVLWLECVGLSQNIFYCEDKTRCVCETRMPPAATKSKYGKNL